MKLIGVDSSFFNKPLFYYIGGILTALVFVVLSYRLFLSQDSVILNTSLNSPDNKYTAVYYTNMGGGAAGYCYSYISIVPYDRFADFQKAKYTVTSGRCSNKGTISWEDTQTLLIQNYISDNNQRRNFDGKVNVNLVIPTVQYVDLE